MPESEAGISGGQVQVAFATSGSTICRNARNKGAENYGFNIENK